MIRRATQDDIPAIEDILLDAVRWMDGQGMHQWEEEAVRFPNLTEIYGLSSKDFIVYTEADGASAACMAIDESDPFFWPGLPEEGRSLYLHKLAVKRAFAGRGYASRLLGYAKQYARENDYAALRLDCHQRRPKVRRLYEREGFSLVGERTIFKKYETAFYIYRL